MKNIIILLALTLLTIASCKSSTKRDSNSSKNESVIQVEYTCSMHPEVMSEKPGKCPKCGMELIEKEAKTDSGQATSTEHKH